MTIALAAILGYLLGSIPFGLVITRLAGLGDIRAIGSGNIGATNVLRTGRKDLALATLLLDGGKGAIAVVLALLLGWRPEVAAAVKALPAGDALLHDPLAMGAALITVITATCIVFEIIGPILTKIALRKAGEIPDPTDFPDPPSV